MTLPSDFKQAMHGGRRLRFPFAVKRRYPSDGVVNDGMGGFAPREPGPRFYNGGLIAFPLWPTDETIANGRSYIRALSAFERDRLGRMTPEATHLMLTRMDRQAVPLESDYVVATGQTFEVHYIENVGYQNKFWLWLLSVQH